jgi:hypothetical protein
MVGCCGMGAAGPCNAQDATPPTESAFIRKLTDEAIAADRVEPICDDEQSRASFADAFLGGYSTPSSTGVPVNPAFCTSRMNGRGWDAGMAYRRAHPDSVVQIMREYGYKEVEAVGAWNYGFEAGDFHPDSVADVSTSQTCWLIRFVHSANLDAQLLRIVSPEARLHSATFRVRVKGYLTPLSSLELAGCQRQLYAISITADRG